MYWFKECKVWRLAPHRLLLRILKSPGNVKWNYTLQRVHVCVLKVCGKGVCVGWFPARFQDPKSIHKTKSRCSTTLCPEYDSARKSHTHFLQIILTCSTTSLSFHLVMNQSCSPSRAALLLLTLGTNIHIRREWFLKSLLPVWSIYRSNTSKHTVSVTICCYFTIPVYYRLKASLLWL